MVSNLVLFSILNMVDRCKPVSRLGIYDYCPCCFGIYEHFKHIIHKYEAKDVIKLDHFEIIDKPYDHWEMI